jgi:hypothetical protein
MKMSTLLKVLIPVLFFVSCQKEIVIVGVTRNDTNTSKDSTGTSGSGTIDTSTNTGGTTVNPVNLDENTWQFSTPSATYTGQVQLAMDTTLLGVNSFTFVGGMASGNADTVLTVSMTFPSSGPRTGSYSSSSTAYPASMTFGTALSGYIYTAGAYWKGSSLLIVISDYSNGVLTGTFSGGFLDASDKSVAVKNGAFKVKVK